MWSEMSNASGGFMAAGWWQFFVAMIIGIILAFLLAWGLVMSQTAAPSTNPASKNPLVYGE